MKMEKTIMETIEAALNLMPPRYLNPHCKESAN